MEKKSRMEVVGKMKPIEEEVEATIVDAETTMDNVEDSIADTCINYEEAYNNSLVEIESVRKERDNVNSELEKLMGRYDKLCILYNELIEKFLNSK